MADDKLIVAAVDSYVVRRDRLQARHTIAPPVPQGEFLEMLDGSAVQLGEALPSMSLAQLQGFTELVNELLVLRRDKLDPFRRR